MAVCGDARENGMEMVVDGNEEGLMERKMEVAA